MDNLDIIDRELLNMTEESIRNIKMMVIVALIYEITLNLDEDLKPKIRRFFQEIVKAHPEMFDRDQRDRF